MRKLKAPSSVASQGCIVYNWWKEGSTQKSIGSFDTDQPTCIRTTLSLSRLWLFEQNVHTLNIWSEISVDPGISGTHLNQQQEFPFPKSLSVIYNSKSLAAHVRQTYYEETSGELSSWSMGLGLHWGGGRENSLCAVPLEHGEQQIGKQGSLKTSASSGCWETAGTAILGRERRGICHPLFLLTATTPHRFIKRNGSEKSNMILTAAP